MTQDALSLAETLQEFRERKGLSRRALSRAADLSASYVGKLEAGEIEPSLHAFLQITRALELSEKQVALCIRIAISESVSAS